MPYFPIPRSWWTHEHDCRRRLSHGLRPCQGPAARRSPALRNRRDHDEIVRYPQLQFLPFAQCVGRGRRDRVDCCQFVRPVEHVVERTHLVHSLVEKVRINLRNRIVSRNPLYSKCLELGVINPRFVAKKNRYAYMSIGAPLPKLCGVVKLDFDMVEAMATMECMVASRSYGEGCFDDEMFFVPQSSDPNAEEDNRYIVAFTHNEGTGISSSLVMDAQSLTLEIVASIELRARVSYNFHCLFVSDADLAN